MKRLGFRHWLDWYCNLPCLVQGIVTLWLLWFAAVGFLACYCIAGMFHNLLG